MTVYGYARISVDEELDKDNTSIEHQCAIITDFAARHFPGAALELFQDRDRSGYTFEQRPAYQSMRRRLMAGDATVLIVKDFSRFARRNSRGLVELEDLRDAGVRIISIGDNIDYPTGDEWLQIQFRFLLNEMPVTDTSKKVRGIVSHRQQNGNWLCAVPYGYCVKNWAAKIIEVDEAAAAIIRSVYERYLEGWGYKKIANWLTEQAIPTPRTLENERRLAAGETIRREAKPQWSIATVQGILTNDFYIGTLRQHKYQRTKINGSDRRTDASEQFVFENHHPAILTDQRFLKVQEQMKLRTKSNYRGVKKYENNYSGLLRCGDCGAPMFSMSRPDLKPAYTCGTYHRRGTAGCSSHHIRVSLLDDLLRRYLQLVRDNAADMMAALKKTMEDSPASLERSRSLVELLEKEEEDVKLQLKSAKKQKIRDLTRHPERQSQLDELYGEIEEELSLRLEGLKNQLALAISKNNAIAQASRTARTVLSVFDDILTKPSLARADIELIVEEIKVYESHADIRLKADIDSLLRCAAPGGDSPEQASIAALAKGAAPVNFESGIIDSLQTRIVQSSVNRKDKVYGVNVINSGDPLEIYTDKEGGVIFKKYSLMSGLGEFAAQLCDTLHKTTGRTVVIADRDNCIAVAGSAKRALTDKRISPQLEQIMEARQIYQHQRDGSPIPVCEESDGFFLETAAPILTDSDPMGCVIFCGPRDTLNSDEVEVKLAQTIAGFLGKHMEA